MVSRNVWNIKSLSDLATRIRNLIVISCICKTLLHQTLGWIFHVSRKHMNTKIGFSAAPRLKWSENLWKLFSLSQNNLGNHISSAEIVSEKKKRKKTGKVLEMGKSDMENFEKHKIYWNKVLHQHVLYYASEDKHFLKQNFSVNPKQTFSPPQNFPSSFEAFWVFSYSE